MASLASCHCSARSPSSSGPTALGPPKVANTLRCVVMVWATKSRTVQSSCGVGADHCPSEITSTLAEKPLATSS